MISKIILVLAVSSSILFSEKIFSENISMQLRAEIWDTRRHGEALLKVNSLSTIMQKWMPDTTQTIYLRYPGGEEGELWVEELKDWFVSLGVPSEKIQVSPGSEAEDIINIVIIKLADKK